MKKLFIVQICAAVLLAIICTGVYIQKNRLYDQSAAKRWAEEGMAQITMFYPAGDKRDDYYFLEFAHKLENALEGSAISGELAVDQETGLSFPDAVSISGTVTVASENGTTQMDVIGVKGDFFLFHPVNLICGSYISADDLMDDGIILDEDAAWKLFGSNDIVGKQVFIGDVPHYVKGVVKKADDRFSLKAGLDSTTGYVSYNTLQKYGNVMGSYSYEVIIPDPVDDFAVKIVRDTLSDADNKIEIIENSYRFNNVNLRSVAFDFGVRSMSNNGIVYPYYENVARAWEDVFAFILIIQSILVIIIVGIALKLYVEYRRTASYKSVRKSFKRFRKNIVKRTQMFAGKMKKQKREEEL